MPSFLMPAPGKHLLVGTIVHRTFVPYPVTHMSLRPLLLMPVGCNLTITHVRLKVKSKKIVQIQKNTRNFSLVYFFAFCAFTFAFSQYV